MRATAPAPAFALSDYDINESGAVLLIPGLEAYASSVTELDCNQSETFD
jgi:hypothetical protein